MGESMSIEPRAAWEQLPDETDADYGWFITYLELGDDRTLAKTARRAGVRKAAVERAASSFNWSQRCMAWKRDTQSVLAGAERDEEAVHDAEWHAGVSLIRLAVRGFNGKNPELMDVKSLTAILKEGIELARRGSGAADMVIAVEDRRNIEGQFADFLGEEDA